jgi:hypothetical protein
MPFRISDDGDAIESPHAGFIWLIIPTRRPGLWELRHYENGHWRSYAGGGHQPLREELGRIFNRLQKGS